MPLVKVEAADDYLDVAHLAEDKKGIGSGGAKRRLAGMIAPRYLARDSGARPRDVQVAGPYDSAASLDDNVSVITLETCLRQMEASGTSVWPWRRPWQNRTPKCREEEREEAKEEEERRQREEEEEAASLAAEAPMEDAATTVVAEGEPDISTPHMTAEMQEDEAELQAAAESQDAESSEEEMNETERLAQAMLTLASQSCVTGERSRLIGLVQNELDLMREIETSDATAETSYMSFGGGKGLQCTRGTSKRRADPGYSSEIKNAASAAGRVANMLRDVDKELAALDQKVGDSMRIFDSDNDGVISVNEIGSAPEEVFLRHIRKDGMNNGKKYKEKVLRLFQSIDTDGDGKITLEEIKSALKTMEKYK